MNASIAGSVRLVADELAVLGIATSSRDGALIVSRVIVRLTGDDVEVERLKPWQGTPRDEARSQRDLVDALGNVLDRKRDGAPEALAVKRPESPVSRPTVPYDQKTRAEGAAMIAATSQGRRYFSYRKGQLGHGEALNEAAKAHANYPSAEGEQDAVAAACAALAELVDDSETDD
jgi:hypothetical protein